MSLLTPLIMFYLSSFENDVQRLQRERLLSVIPALITVVGVQTNQSTLLRRGAQQQQTNQCVASVATQSTNQPISARRNQLRPPINQSAHDHEEPSMRMAPVERQQTHADQGGRYGTSFLRTISQATSSLRQKGNRLRRLVLDSHSIIHPHLLRESHNTSISI